MRGDFSIDSGQKMMRVLIQQRVTPTAVLCANDEMAIGAIRALKAVNLRVPEDISIVGFDDQEFAQICDPPLTTVHIPRFDVGYQSMMMLSEVITHQRAVRSTILATRLVIRASTAAPKRRS